MKTFNFTKTSLQQLPLPNKQLAYYKDEKEKGLSLYITKKGIITFFVRKRVNGIDERILLGNFPTMTIENARKKILEVRVRVAQGQNPNEDKRKIRAEITFGEMFVQFMERYSKPFKRSWKYDEREVNRFLSHWFKRKASQISKQEIHKLHEQICTENGLYQANRILERISSIYNKLIEWGWEGLNPTKGIKKFKENSRDRFINPDELPRFLESLEQEENETIKDYVYTSLLTGARKSNVLAMRWNELCFIRNEWRIPETKNGEPLVIPLVSTVIEILKKRKENNTNSEYVFPGIGSKGFLQDPKKGWKRILRRAGIKDLRVHDIRRTMGSYQAITGASLSIIGKSLGHKSQHATQIYARLHNDPVRLSMEKATEAMFATIKDKEDKK